MQKVLLVGAGQGGTTLLKMLMEIKAMEIIAVVDIEPDAPGMQLAKKLGILTSSEWKPLLSNKINIVIEATGSNEVFEDLLKCRSRNTVIIPGTVAHIISNLINQKENLITALKDITHKHETIFDSTNDGMIVIDDKERVILFNKTAERMTGLKKGDVIGRLIEEMIPSSKLPRILKTKEVEMNQEQVLENGLKIITTRIPIFDDTGALLGALSLFKDITDIVNLAEEMTNLKEIQTLLQAIIQSSDEAISVVDEEGRGILINPAYSRMTGLTEEQVLGKPATADISEGESMHMKVLETRRPVRGVRMKVGPGKKDVIVNVAPIIVDGILKGSVGIIHDMSEIQTLTTELNRARQIIRTLEAKYAFEDIIGASEEIKLAIEQAKLGAKTPATVLLRGESGTGKELFAHAIHNASDRKYNKFIRVNCAAISETLLESELFGYEEGAFSGAKRGGKRGFFEEANKGSIFLDEIGELSANVQAKLLRVLQEKEIVRVGSTKSIPINVRVIAATNINIEKAMADGTFREDLYYRLNRYPISIPPLRNRKRDIPMLAEHLIRKLNQDYGRSIEGIEESALDRLVAHSWPGNVRELENVIGRAMIFMKYNEMEIAATHLPELAQNDEKKSGGKAYPIESAGNQTLAESIEQLEEVLIREALNKHNFNRTKTALSLGISLRNLYYKIEKYNLAK
ncbi:sigma 54-interacting transcriptional regulator [Metabacillus hrfriensis]|uniref:Sigma 54-interacting transcriptional regulator n=1 Tax=Metabacillus hrfriensis TaxID=3048891 RepID=A0ACD4R7R3_9BACI|nr:sigma 54-interacting transcriptional regulator [Metabacillus sp. CT-WN-B3]USK27239.1 sigma 54-interacting transcriptional regulator [Bacillus sp. CMF21]WHZ56464.1 sigma 54-interacting transcriptional regulator [Metabacillus sp. CT-WN-B3]